MRLEFVRMSEAGRVVIPVRYRKLLKLKRGDVLKVEECTDGDSGAKQILISKVPVAK